MHILQPTYQEFIFLSLETADTAQDIPTRIESCITLKLNSLLAIASWTNSWSRYTSIVTQTTAPSLLLTKKARFWEPASLKRNLIQYETICDVFYSKKRLTGTKWPLNVVIQTEISTLRSDGPMCVPRMFLSN